MLRGTLDAAVVTEKADLPDRLNRWPLFTDAVVLIVPPGHVLDGNPEEAVPLAALDEEAVICWDLECELMALLRQAHCGHGVQPGHQHRADTPARTADLVRGGLGVALSTERAVVPGGLRRRPVAGARPHGVLLVAVAGRPFTRTADAFIKLARAREWGALGAC